MCMGEGEKKKDIAGGRVGVLNMIRSGTVKCRKDLL